VRTLILTNESKSEARIDALDLVINVLKEHEKGLDRLVERLEALVSILEKAAEGKVSPVKKAIMEASVRLPKVQCEKWEDFKEKSKGMGMVAFEAEKGHFTVYSASDAEAYTYSEDLPCCSFQLKEKEDHFSVEKILFNHVNDLTTIFEKRLMCGLEVFIKSSKVLSPDGNWVIELTCGISPETAKAWLSRELNISEKNIVMGKIVPTQ
jgi:hypothetical protein